MQSVGLEHCRVLEDRDTAEYESVEPLSSIAIRLSVPAA